MPCAWLDNEHGRTSAHSVRLRSHRHIPTKNWPNSHALRGFTPMDVQVKTTLDFSPLKEKGPQSAGNTNKPKKKSFGFDDNEGQSIKKTLSEKLVSNMVQRNPRKRRHSERAGHQGPPRKNFGRYTGRSTEKRKIMPLPRRFFLGGDISDPLNLNSLYGDSELGKALNEKTPQSSPLPLPTYKQQVKVLIPPNISDPLNLNAAEDVDLAQSLLSLKQSGKRKKHKHKKRRSAGDISESTTETPTEEIKQPAFTEPLSPSIEDPLSASDTEIIKLAICKIDAVLSVPPTDCSTIAAAPVPSEDIPSNDLPTQTEDAASQQPSPIVKVDMPIKAKPKKQTSQTDRSKQKKGVKFVYGNYNKYYGYRNPDLEEDHRLKYIRREWTVGKDMLDIGCNIGHVTLMLARDYGPSKIVGMDIDSKLIGIARKNIRHYLTREKVDSSKFPTSLPLTYGPIAAVTPATEHSQGFPHNVMFVQGSYVLDTDEQLEMQQEEYDTILALSVTKWLHLNWGDAGLKRAFKRMYRQLRPGGHLILEPQSWSSYKKKKKLTDAIFKTFQQIRFRPEQFTAYLLSREVGFATCELIDTPFNKSKGFQRPIQVYTKPHTRSRTPSDWLDSTAVTPLMDLECTPSRTPFSTSAATPARDLGSSIGNTPKLDTWSSSNTPTYLCASWPQQGSIFAVESESLRPNLSVNLSHSMSREFTPCATEFTAHDLPSTSDDSRDSTDGLPRRKTSHCPLVQDPVREAQQTDPDANVSVSRRNTEDGESSPSLWGSCDPYQRPRSW